MILDQILEKCDLFQNGISKLVVWRSQNPILYSKASKKEGSMILIRRDKNSHFG